MCVFGEHKAAAYGCCAPGPCPARMNSSAWSFHPCSSGGSDGSCSSCQAWCRAGSFGEESYKRPSLNHLCKGTGEALSPKPHSLSSGAMVVMTLAFQKGDYRSPQVLRGGYFSCYLNSCFRAISASLPQPCVWILKGWWRWPHHAKSGLLLLRGSWLFIGLNVGW